MILFGPVVRYSWRTFCPNPKLPLVEIKWFSNYSGEKNEPAYKKVVVKLYNAWLEVTFLFCT